MQRTTVTREDKGITPCGAYLLQDILGVPAGRQLRDHGLSNTLITDLDRGLETLLNPEIDACNKGAIAVDLGFFVDKRAAVAASLFFTAITTKSAPLAVECLETLLPVPELQRLAVVVALSLRRDNFSAQALRILGAGDQEPGTPPGLAFSTQTGGGESQPSLQGYPPGVVEAFTTFFASVEEGDLSAVLSAIESVGSIVIQRDLEVCNLAKRCGLLLALMGTFVEDPVTKSLAMKKLVAFGSDELNWVYARHRHILETVQPDAKSQNLQGLLEKIKTFLEQKRPN